MQDFPIPPYNPLPTAKIGDTISAAAAIVMGNKLREHQPVMVIVGAENDIKAVYFIEAGEDQEMTPTQAAELCGKIEESPCFEELKGQLNESQQELLSHACLQAAYSAAKHTIFLQNLVREAPAISYCKEQGYHCYFGKDLPEETIKKMLEEVGLQ